MNARPIALLGSDRGADGASRMPAGVWFDAAVGVWRDQRGALAVRSAGDQSTISTRTRESADQGESSSVMCTYITKTHEGTDQVETSAAV